MQIKIRVVSQNRPLFEGEAFSINVPSKEGKITILPQHSELISLLDIGELTINQDSSQDKTQILVNGGLLYVRNDEVLVLADDATMPHELTKHEIEEAIKNAMEEISGELPPTLFIQLEKQLKFAMFKKSFLENANLK